MAMEQIRNLLDLCFSKGKDGSYTPVMISMKIKRSRVTSEDHQHAPAIDSTEVTIQVPLVSLLPVVHLGVESLNFKVGMEIHGAYQEKSQKRSESTAGWVHKHRSVGLSGKIVSTKSSSDVSIDVKAGVTPISNGLATIIESYTKSIGPTENPHSSAS